MLFLGAYAHAAGDGTVETFEIRTAVLSAVSASSVQKGCSSRICFPWA